LARNSEHANDRPRPLWDHVEELSRRLKIWLYAFSAATIIFLAFPTDWSFIRNPITSGYAYNSLITAILVDIRKYLLPSQYTLIGGTVTTPLELILVGAVIFGFTASVPVLAYEIYQFVDPAIRPSERQSVKPFVLSFSTLFVAGVLFGFFVLLPIIFFFSIPFFQATSIPTIIFADQFYYLVFFTLIVSGLTFTLPVFFVLLVKLHVVGTAALTKNRKYVWAITLILTAIASPDGGPLADIALFVPIIALLEGSIRVARRYEKTAPEVVPVPPREQLTAKCAYCGGNIDPGGVFCGLCGKSRA
jgi:sec-independent protein translocase protein TatC